jgi:hypothetical protein
MRILYYSTEEKFMFDDPEGPIEHFSWGKFIIRGEEHSKGVGEGKDICVLADEVLHWERMGGHQLKRKSVRMLKGMDIDTLIIGNGVNGVVEVSEKVKDEIGKMGVPYLIIETTPQSCKTYNEKFRKGEKVCLLAHGTC